MAHRDGDKLLAAYADPEFVNAIDALARLDGVTRSALVRFAVAQFVLAALVEQPSTPSPDQQEVTL